jgi:hypothetical protein
MVHHTSGFSHVMTFLSLSLAMMTMMGWVGWDLLTNQLNYQPNWQHLSANKPTNWLQLPQAGVVAFTPQQPTTIQNITLLSMSVLTAYS